jgi:hypothetical protein
MIRLFLRNYSFSFQHYLFSVAFVLLCCSTTARAQSLLDTQLSGRVITEGNEPLAGATVLVKGTSLGASTNTKGDFIFSPQDLTFPLTLTISYVGFGTEEVIVNQLNEQVVVTLILDLAPAYKVPEDMLSVPVAAAQLGGRVITEGDEPLAGAAVLVKGASLGASTNSKGDFILNPQNLTFPLILRVSYVGFRTEEVLVNQLNEQVVVTLTPNRAVTKQIFKWW